MTMTQTNTNTKTRTKINTKIEGFKGSMYVIFLKGMGFNESNFILAIIW